MIATEMELRTFRGSSGIEWLAVDEEQAAEMDARHAALSKQTIVLGLMFRKKHSLAGISPTQATTAIAMVDLMPLGASLCLTDSRHGYSLGVTGLCTSCCHMHLRGEADLFE